MNVRATYATTAIAGTRSGKVAARRSSGQIFRRCGCHFHDIFHPGGNPATVPVLLSSRPEVLGHNAWMTDWNENTAHSATLRFGMTVFSLLAQAR